MQAPLGRQALLGLLARMVMTSLDRQAPLEQMVPLARLERQDSRARLGCLD